MKPVQTTAQEDVQTSQQKHQQAAKHYKYASVHREAAAECHASGDDKAAEFEQKAEAYQNGVAHTYSALATKQEIEDCNKPAIVARQISVECNPEGAELIPPR
ncbi:MAG: hypothetical protein WC208_14855 [Gallionella sp.]|jgi:hypothetical protein